MPSASLSFFVGANMDPVAWLLLLALSMAPPEKAKSFPGYAETVEQRTARYASIARDIAAVVDAAPPLPNLDRPQSAALLLALAAEETDLDLDADKGPCFHGVWQGRSWAWRCDGGRAVGLLQIHTHSTERAAMFADRPRVLRVGYRHLRRALGARCRYEDRLAVLASGCDHPRSVIGSRRVFALWHRAMLTAAPAWPTRGRLDAAVATMTATRHGARGDRCLAP